MLSQPGVLDVIRDAANAVRDASFATSGAAG
jgi:hypothetical protein